MLKLISCENPIIANHYFNILQTNNINCVLKNENLQAVAGGIMAHQWPEIWLLDEMQQAKAKALIEELDQLDQTACNWQCSKCESDNEAQFNACWSCGEAKTIND
jgi:hypothetical protein